MRDPSDCGESDGLLRSSAVRSAGVAEVHPVRARDPVVGRGRPARRIQRLSSPRREDANVDVAQATEDVFDDEHGCLVEPLGVVDGEYKGSISPPARAGCSTRRLRAPADRQADRHPRAGARLRWPGVAASAGAAGLRRARRAGRTGRRTAGGPRRVPVGTRRGGRGREPAPRLPARRWSCPRRPDPRSAAPPARNAAPPGTRR